MKLTPNILRNTLIQLKHQAFLLEHNKITLQIFNQIQSKGFWGFGVLGFWGYVTNNQNKYKAPVWVFFAG